jgi:hypothetical protein
MSQNVDENSHVILSLKKITAKPTGDYVYKNNETQYAETMNVVIDEDDKIYFAQRYKQIADLKDIYELWMCNPLTNEWSHFSLSFNSTFYYVGTRIHVRRKKLYLVCLNIKNPRTTLMTVELKEFRVSNVREITAVSNWTNDRCYDFTEEKMFFFNYDEQGSLSGVCLYDIDENAWTEIDISHVRLLQYPMDLRRFRFFVINDAYLIREICGKIEVYDLKSGRLLRTSEIPSSYTFIARKDTRLYFDCERRSMYVFDCVRFEWMHFLNNNEDLFLLNDWKSSKVLCSQNSSKLYYVMCKYVENPICACNCHFAYKIKDVGFAIASTVPFSLKELATLKVAEELDIYEVRKVLNNITI